MLRRYRRRRGLSQEKLAHLIGYASGTRILEIENGSRLPPIEIVIRLAEALRLDDLETERFLYAYFYDLSKKNDIGMPIIIGVLSHIPLDIAALN